MSNDELKELKARCLEELREALPDFTQRLAEIDDRVLLYALDCCRIDTDIHNVDEILGLRRFLRYISTYDTDIETIRRVLKDAEGIWTQDELGRWEHVDFGLKIDTMLGYRHTRLSMSQVFILVGIYGFKTWKDTKVTTEMRQPEPYEKTEGNRILDHKRVITSYIMMTPRKYAKTYIGAFVQYEGLIRGERDYEGYICANNADQSAILFRQLKNMVMQFDNKGKWLRMTQTTINWLPKSGRSGSVTALTAGGKTKDGLKASTCSADEYGAAQRVKDHCDMEGLINVVQGSMGPRREPLTVHTSTAGLGTDTPYEHLIRNYHEELLREMEIPIGKAQPMKNDWQYGIILRPDPWEYDEKFLRDPRVIKKVNPHLGITIQADFYEQEWKAADMQGELKRKEVITKLYNIFQSDRAKDWVKPETIRALQVPMTISDCLEDDGWSVFAGLDLSLGDDLNAVSYLAWRINPHTGYEEFFADLDCWMTTKAINDNSLSSLYKLWGEKGHLHVIEGETLDPAVAVDRIVELYQKGVNFISFGYDPYQAKFAANALKAWVYEEGGEPKDVIIPVRQNFATYNPLVGEMDLMIKSETPLIRFSESPLWPFCFGNCMLQVSNDTMENVKPVKANNDAKVDPVQALLSALYCFDLISGKEG